MEKHLCGHHWTKKCIKREEPTVSQQPDVDGKQTKGGRKLKKKKLSRSPFVDDVEIGPSPKNVVVVASDVRTLRVIHTSKAVTISVNIFVLRRNTRVLRWCIYTTTGIAVIYPYIYFLFLLYSTRDTFGH